MKKYLNIARGEGAQILVGVDLVECRLFENLLGARIEKPGLVHFEVGVHIIARMKNLIALNAGNDIPGSSFEID